MRQLADLRASIGAQFPLLDLALHHHRTTRGQSMSFVDMPYLIELYADFAAIDGADVEKCVQGGLTELMILLQLRDAGWLGRTATYILPKDQVRNRFVQNRIDPLLGQVPAYLARCPGGLPPDKQPDNSGQLKPDGRFAANLTLKKFGYGTLMYLGANTDTNFVEFSTDTMIIDELDRCDQANLELAKDRLRAAPSPTLFRISNPTIPNRGIDAIVAEGEGRRWHHRCDRCGERQPLDWFEHVVERLGDGKYHLRDLNYQSERREARPVCRRCHRTFPRTPDGGLWVAARPGVGRRSYHLSRLDVLSQSLSDMFTEFVRAEGKPDRMRVFFNSLLGMTYEPYGQGVSVELLDAVALGPPIDLVGGKAYRRQKVTAGIDVGNVLHVTISVVERARIPGPREVPSLALEEEDDGADYDPDGDEDYQLADEIDDDVPPDADDEDGLHEEATYTRRCAVHIAEVPSFSAVLDLLEQFHVDVAVCDAGPETTKAKELRDAGAERGIAVWLCRFAPTERVGDQPFGMTLDEAARVVTVDRTQVLDQDLEDMRIDPPTRVLPSDVMSVPGFAEQMRAPKRMLNERGTRYIWDEGGKADHYRFACAYDLIAYHLLGRGGDYAVL